MQINQSEGRHPWITCTKKCSIDQFYKKSQCTNFGETIMHYLQDLALYEHEGTTHPDLESCMSIWYNQSNL